MCAKPCTRRFRQGHLACGGDGDRLHVFNGTLRKRVVGAHGVDFIIKKLDAHRVFRGDWKHVKIPAAQANLPLRLTNLHALIARINQPFEQRLRLDHLSCADLCRHRAKRPRRGKALQQRGCGNGDEHVFPAKQPGKRLYAARRKPGRRREAASGKRHIARGQMDCGRRINRRLFPDAHGGSFVCRNHKHGFSRIAKQRCRHMRAVRFSKAEYGCGTFIFHQRFPQPPVFRVSAEKLNERMLIHSLPLVRLCWPA